MNESLGNAALDVSLLGHVRAATHEVPVRLSGRQAQALFALLVLDRRRRSREALGVDLWPDGGGGSPGGLRQALWLVRSALSAAGLDPESVLDVDGDAIGLRRGIVGRLDVKDFERAARGIEADPETAVALYGGDLVEPLGHECFAAERERLADLYEDALAAAAAARLATGDATGARALAEELLARDPLREEAHSVLISVYGRTGTRSQVVRQYRRLCGVLARELEVEPLPETELAFRDAMAVTVERSRRSVARRPIPFGAVARRRQALRNSSLGAVGAG